LQQQIIVTENMLNRLLGRFPQPIIRDKAMLVAPFAQNTKISVPAKLLDNRPDVKQAALKLKAAKLDVKSARARFYPALSIDAGVGYESFRTKHFFNTPESLFYNAAANLTAPILNRMAIKADYFSANNKQIQSIYHYELAIIDAYAEVANQLATIDNLKTINELKSKQVDALTESVDISNMLFRAARIDYLESLLTQRDSLKAQIELVEVQKQQLIAYVNLYKALGGGWRTETKAAKVE
jgi:outer membrane protein TolC